MQSPNLCNSVDKVMGKDRRENLDSMTTVAISRQIEVGFAKYNSSLNCNRTITLVP